MVSRKRLVTALAVVVVGVATTVTHGASVSENHTMYLTFNRPVALPGVALGSGTYIFEMPNLAGTHALVRVLSRDRKIVYLAAFTNPVTRPAGLPPNQRISFAEAPPNRPQPISVWWADDSAGRAFIYDGR